MESSISNDVKEYFSREPIIDIYSQIDHYKNIPFFLFHLKKGDKVLDVGCSSGGFDWLLSKVGVEILGIDISERAIEKARELNRDYKKAKFLVNDISGWRNEEKYDYVLGLFNLLGFIPANEGRINALDNMLYMLKDSGRLYLTFTRFNLKIIIRALCCYMKNKVCGKPVEFWDTWDYHPKVDIPIFKHNLFPYELKKMLGVVGKKHSFKYEFTLLDKTNFLLTIEKNKPR